MMEDESTDDELGVNLQLGERLQINRQPHSSYHNTRSRTKNSKEHKEYWNGRKRDMCTSSCSAAVNPHCSDSPPINGWFVPETPSPYQLGNKKRQNRDRNGEQIAKSKRTCFNVYPNWKETRIKSRHYKDPQHCASIPRDCSSLPETSVKTEPSASASTSGANSFLDINSSDLNIQQKNIPPDEKYRDFMENIPSFSEIDGTNSSSSNFSCADLLFGNGQRNGTSLKSYDASLSFPSTSSSGQSLTDAMQNSGSRMARSIPLGVQYIDSESDESNRLYAKRGALKGGKQVESNHFQGSTTSKCSAPLLESDDSNDILCHSKVIGKCARQVVESDDDDDSDDSTWHPAFRKHRSKILISESEEESVGEHSESLVSSMAHGFSQSKKKSSALRDSHCSSFNSRSAYAPLPCGEKSNEDSDHFISNCLKSHQNSAAPKTKKCSRSRRGTHSKSGKIFPSCDCSSPAGPASQTKLRSCLRHRNRSGSPHPRSLRHRRHSRGLSRNSGSQMNNSSNPSSRNTGLPKEFNPEDSSDVEFFSANSYSESENFGDIDLSSTFSACSGLRSEGNHVYERTISAPESSEDEVSVVFTANPPFRDGSNNSRHRRHRGTARRRHSRVQGRGSRSQDTVSVSPDPVEQVRQMEEDERLARFLQAQFDAEVVTEDCRPEAHHHHHHHHIMDSDNEDEEIDPVGDISDDLSWLYEESLQSENVGADHHHHHPFAHSPTFIPPALHRGRIRGRPRMAVLSFSTINNNSGRGRNVRRRYMHGGIAGDPWVWQFARMMGHTIGRSFDSEGADYEALWELAEDVGEAIPRGLNKSEINRLPTRKFINNISGGDAASSKDCDVTTHKRTELNKECQVCLCDYESGDVLRILPCFHEFHTACIDPWLKINHTCPVCRVEVDLEEN